MMLRKIIFLALSFWLVISLACSLPMRQASISKPTPQESTVAPAPPPDTYDEQALTVLADPGTGHTFYVAGDDPGASDENSGESLEYQGGTDGPWKTVQHAAEMANAGDTIYARGGVYEESGIHFAHSGSPGEPITLEAYQGEQVVLDGSGSKKEIPGIYLSEGQGYFVFRGLEIRSMRHSGIATDPKAATPYRGIVIQDSNLHDNAQSGIELAGVDGFLIERVEAYKNEYYGLNIVNANSGKLPGAHGLIRDSSFHDHTGKDGHGLSINPGHDITVRNSVSYHNTIHGFDASNWPKNQVVSYNLVFEHNLSYDNGGAGFSINSDSHHVRYLFNTAVRNGAAWAGHGDNPGFLCYDGCWHVEYFNNVSGENTFGGFVVQKEWGVLVKPADSLLVYKNNVTYNNGVPGQEYRLALLVVGTHWEVVAENNDWSGANEPDEIIVAIHVVLNPNGKDTGETYTVQQIQQGLFQTGNLSIDPGFADVRGEDFGLQAGSPLIDAGIDAGQPFCGKAPDIGAVETCAQE